MKIVSWNLRNIGYNKLSKTFAAKFQTYGLGNTVLDYIVNVVMGNDNWEEVVSPVPPDLFVVVELKSGGSTKGGAVSDKCLNTLAALRNAMNYALGPLKHSTSEYTYDFVTPLLTGHHETVGFIFNTRTLTPVEARAERDTTTGTYLAGRTPLYVTFSLVEKPRTMLRVAGIHAPPPRGTATAGNLHLRPPIDWCARLANTPTAAAGPNSFITGDFNCQPSDQYTNGAGTVVRWTTGLNGFTTDLPNNTLSSVRRTYASTQPGKAAYLSAAYDNSIFNVAHTPIADQGVPDLIGEARAHAYTGAPALYPDRAVSLLKAYNVVSDHLPVITEFNVLQ